MRVEQALTVQTDRREDLVVPVDVAARPVGLADQLLVQADRLVRLAVELGIDG